MADATTSAPPNLKYLGFFRQAVMKAVAYISCIYNYGKDSTGSLKPGVDRVEGTVYTVLGPVISKLDGKPDELLVFIDTKMAALFAFLHGFVPDVVKERGSIAVDYAKATPGNAKHVYEEVKDKGVVATSKAYYDKYLPVAKQTAYGAWKLSLKLPLVPQVVTKATPTALFGLEKYNVVVASLQGHSTSALKTVGSYLPTAPLAEIEKTVKADTDAAVKFKKTE